MRECITKGIPVLASAEGAKQYTVGEFNSSCVGISKFQACASPDKGIHDVTGFNLVEATMVADTAGAATIAALDAKKRH